MNVGVSGGFKESRPPVDCERGWEIEQATVTMTVERGGLLME